MNPACLSPARSPTSSKLTQAYSSSTTALVYCPKSSKQTPRLPYTATALGFRAVATARASGSIANSPLLLPASRSLSIFLKHTCLSVFHRLLRAGVDAASRVFGWGRERQGRMEDCSRQCEDAPRGPCNCKTHKLARSNGAHSRHALAPHCRTVPYSCTPHPHTRADW